MQEIEGYVPPTGPMGPLKGITEEDKVKLLLDLMGISTMSKSQKEAIMLLLLVSRPELPAPSEIGVLVGETESNVVSDMLDNWLESIEEQAEKHKEWIKSPAYQVWLETHSPAERGKIEDENELRTSYFEGMGDYLRTVREDPEAAIPFMTASFVIAASFIGDAHMVVDTASTELVGVNPIQDAATQFHHIVPPDFRDNANLVVNLFAMGVMYYATAETIGGVGKGERPKDLNFARNFAKGVIDKVNSNDINALLGAMLVHKSEKGEPVTKDRINQMATMAKLIMLALALAIVYKVQTGWLTGQEFAGMMNGEISLPKGEMESEVLQTMKNLLQQLPPEERVKVLIALMEYFDSNPSVEAMLNPKKVYESGLAQSLNLPQQG